MNDMSIADMEAQVEQAKAHLATLKARLKEMKRPKKAPRTSQARVAKLTGVTKAHINAILNGRGNPSANLAMRLHEATGIPREVWIFGSTKERQAAWQEAKEKQA